MPAFIRTTMRYPVEIRGERAYREKGLRDDWPMRALRFDHAGDRPSHPARKIMVQPRGGLPMRVGR